MATHSSVLAWRIPGTGELVGCCLWGRTESDMTEVTQQQQHEIWYISTPTAPLNPEAKFSTVEVYNVSHTMSTFFQNTIQKITLKNCIATSPPVLFLHSSTLFNLRYIKKKQGWLRLITLLAATLSRWRRRKSYYLDKLLRIKVLSITKHLS